MLLFVETLKWWKHPRALYLCMDSLLECVWWAACCRFAVATFGLGLWQKGCSHCCVFTGVFLLVQKLTWQLAPRRDVWTCLPKEGTRAGKQALEGIRTKNHRSILEGLLGNSLQIAPGYSYRENDTLQSWKIEVAVHTWLWITVFSLPGLFSVPKICYCSKICHLFSQRCKMVEIRGTLEVLEGRGARVRWFVCSLSFLFEE